jgi:PAS domain S-box-containing protein
MPTQKRYKVLLIDDSTEDRATYCRYLQRGSSHTYQILEADSAAAGLELYQRSLPDAVLLDYCLPDMDGLDVLAGLQQTGKQRVPVLIITGQGDETIAAQSIKSGAQDYLIKANLTAVGLCQAIEHAIEQFQLPQRIKQQEQQQQMIDALLRENEQRYATLTEMSPVGIFQTDAEGHCLYASQRWCQIAGLTPAEAEGLGWVNGIHPDDREFVASEWYTAAQENRPFYLEYRFQNTTGQITWALGQAAAERGAAGEIIGYVGTITDISDRKAVEQALKIQRDFNQLIAEITSRFVDLSPTDLDAEIERTLQLIGEITQVDTSYLFIFDQEQDMVRMTHEWCKPDYSRQIAKAQAIPQSGCPWSNALLKQREIIYVPYIADLPPEAAIDQATWQHFNLTAVLVVPLIQKSIVTGFMGFASYSQAMDWEEETIRLLRVMGQTIANAQERTQDKYRLYVSEERLRLALAVTNQGLYDLNMQTGEAIVTPEYATMLGYDPSTFYETNARWIERLHPDDREPVANIYQAYVAGTLPEYKAEFRQLTQTGEWKWILSLGRIVSWDATGQPLRMLGTHTDISDRKQSEIDLKQLNQELQASERKFRGIFNNIFQFVGLLTLDGILLEANQTALDFGGLQLADIIDRPFWECYWWTISPATQAQLQQAIARAAQGEFIRYEVDVWGAGDRTTTIDFSLRPLRDESGTVVLLIPEGRDISEAKRNEVVRKQAEVDRLQAKKLRLELTLLENILDIILAGYWDWDLQHNQEYLSPGLKRMFGYEDHELPNSPESWQRLIFAEDLPGVFDCFDRHVQSHGEIPFYNEVRYRHKDGSTIWVICSGKVIEWDAENQPLRMIGCHIDITQRKQAEKELRESEEFNRRMLESSSDCIKLVDLDGRLQYMNAGGQCIMEIDDFSRCLNADWVSFWPESVHPDIKAAITIAKAGQMGKFQGFCPTAKGTPKWWDVVVTPILDEVGQVGQLLSVSRDITDRKQAEDQLRKSAAHLRTAQRIAKMGSWEFDIHTEQITWSEEVFHIFGRDPEAGPPSFEELQQLLHPDDRDRHQQMVQTAIETVQPYEIEYRLYRPDGTLRYIQGRGEPIVDAMGEMIQLVGTVLDITEAKRDEVVRKQAEAELRNLSDRLTLAVKSGAIGIWDWNVTENILIWDDRMSELYGITPDRFTSVYDTWASSLHPDDRPLAEAAIQQALAGEKDYDPEFRVVHPDGTIRFIKAAALVQRNAQGEPQQMIGINFDITELKQTELQLLQTAAQLQASNRELEAFAYSVSHDLRSPLRAIDGFSKALIEDYGEQFGEEGKDYFDRIRHNVNRMGMLIDDLLRLSRVSRSDMQYSAVNLSAIVQEQIEELQISEPDRQVKAVITPEAIVSADATLMRVVLTNLLQNAWKFTSHHATALIEFGVTQLEGELAYFVRDDGAGFDMAYANMLFGVFQRLHNTHEFPGTGIGLATVQRAIHRHGGRVWAEAAVEQGATIYFTVPNIPIRTGS